MCAVAVGQESHSTSRALETLCLLLGIRRDTLQSRQPGLGERLDRIAKMHLAAQRAVVAQGTARLGRRRRRVECLHHLRSSSMQMVFQVPESVYLQLHSLPPGCDLHGFLPSGKASLCSVS